jgi:hypothetical protein
MVFSLEHDIKVTKNHQNLLPTQSVLVAHTVLLRAKKMGHQVSASFEKVDVVQALLSFFLTLFQLTV